MQWPLAIVGALVAIASPAAAIDHSYTLPASLPAGPALPAQSAVQHSKIQLEATRVPPVFEARMDGIFMNGAPFFFKGINYFGFETDILVPHGLWGGKDSTTLSKVGAYLKANDFNAVRLPFTVSAVLQNIPVDKKNIVNEVALLDAFQNKTLPYLDVLDYAIKVFGDNNIVVLLEAHFLDHVKRSIGEVWYTNDADKDNFENAWKILAKRYHDTWNVLGADLKNEPHGKATWGSNDAATDWRLASLKWATSILEITPRWLIFVEGTERSSRDNALNPAPWGGNFIDLQRASLTLPVENRLVLSPHAYGPDVLPLMPYFYAFWSYPNNLPWNWDQHFGFAQGKYGPIVLGEWGGKYRSDWDKKWEDKFAAYLKERSMGWFYWCFNPNGGDTEGLVENDWNTPRYDKLKLLSIFKGTPIP